MYNASNDEGGKVNREHLITGFRLVLKLTQDKFISTSKSNIDKNFDVYLETLITKSFSPKDILHYINLIGSSELVFTEYYIEYLVYTYMVELVNKDYHRSLSKIHQYVEKNPLINNDCDAEDIFTKACGILIGVSLEKLIDYHANIVYTLCIDQEHDEFAMSQLIDQTIIYNKDYTHVHFTTARAGYVIQHLFDRGSNIDPVMAIYAIDKIREGQL